MSRQHGGKLKNWSRMQEEESAGIPYIWRHDIYNQYVIVANNSRATELSGSAFGGVVTATNVDEAIAMMQDFYTLRLFVGRSVPQVRQEAVDWMRRNPEGYIGDEESPYGGQGVRYGEPEFGGVVR